MVALHTQIARLMHTPAEAMADTRHYLLICSAGIPFIMGYNVVCGILRGLGDSRTPLYFVGLACTINIILDFLLVIGHHRRSPDCQYCVCNIVYSHVVSDRLHKRALRPQR